MSMTIERAFEVADLASPLPSMASEALRLMRDRIRELAAREMFTIPPPAAPAGEPDDVQKGFQVLRVLHEGSAIECEEGGRAELAGVHRDALKLLDYCAELHAQHIARGGREEVETGGEAPPVLASPASVTDDRILWGVVANAGRLASQRKQRWVHVVDATGQGSNSSIALCRRFDFDPDEMRGGGDEV